MRTTLLKSLPLLILTGLAAWAGPVDRKQVAADAKWLLHLDANAFRNTKVGTYFLREILDPKSAQGKADLKRELDFDLDWRKIQSATAYGRTFPRQGQDDPTGVLIVTTTLAVEPALERAIARQIPSLQVQKIESPAAPLYSVNNQAYISFGRGGTAVLGKTQAVVEAGRAVLEGKSPNLAGSTALAGFPETAGSFFLLAVAEGFAKEAPLPENAAVLRNAQGARFTVSESGDQVLLNLALRAVSNEVAQQLQQVAQGFVALVALQGNQNPDLQPLAQSLSVHVAGPLVNLNAQLPVPDVLRKLNEKK